MMNNDEIVTTLNNLIETCKDGEQGFKTCADNLDNPQLKSTLDRHAHECAMGAQELQKLVSTLGAEAETSSSLSGDLHRGWIDVKSAVTGKDEASILNECERGEDMAAESYRDALEQDLPEDIRFVVEKQFHGVIRNHDQVKQMRNSARAR